MSDPLASVALALAMGRVPEDLLAQWSAYGDPIVAMWNASQDPVAMVDLLEELDMIGRTSPDRLEYDLLTQYAQEYPEYPRGLMEHAIRMARGGHTDGHAAERLRDELDEASAASPGLFWIPIHCARQLIAGPMEHHSVGSEVRALAALETTPGYPFPQPIVAHHLREGFSAVTAEAVYAAANRIQRAMPRATRRTEQAMLHNNPSKSKRRR